MQLDTEVEVTFSKKAVIGIIGFAAYLISVMTALFRSDLSIFHQGAPLSMMASTMIGLAASSCLNDFLIVKKGSYILLGSGAFPALLLVFAQDTNALVLSIFLGLGFAALTLLWGDFFFVLSHKVIAVVTTCSLAIAGSTILAPDDSVGRYSHYLIAIFIICSCACLLSLRRAHIFSSRKITKAESKKLSLTGESNSFSLIMIGMLIGSSSTFAHLSIDPTTMTTIAGLSTITTCVLMLILRKETEFQIETAMKQFLGFVVALCIAPLPYLPPFGQLCLFALLVMAVSAYLLILVDAIAETARIEEVSSFWKFGKEGAWCALGLCANMMFNQFVFEIGWTSALFASCTFPLLISSLLQIGINTFDHDSFPIKLGDDGKPIRGNVSSAKWKSRIDELAIKYDLSPRQKEVMALLAKGRDAKYIADKFVISPKTAKSHIYNLYIKLGIHSKQELIDVVEQFDNLRER